MGGGLSANPSSTLPGPNAGGSPSSSNNSNNNNGNNITEQSYPGINVYSISGNNFPYNGPKLYYAINSASNLRQYNLKEYVYGYGTDNPNNSSGSGNGSNSNGNGNGNGILSDLSNLSDFDYILIIGAIVVVILVI